MKCPACGTARHSAPATNSRPVEQTVRQRLCIECGHRWYTVEVMVPNTSIGWDTVLRKPVLRDPVRVEALGMERRKAGRPVKECD